MQTQQMHPEVTVHTLSGMMRSENGDMEAHIFAFCEIPNEKNYTMCVTLHGTSETLRHISFPNERGTMNFRLIFVTNQQHANRFDVVACRALYKYLIAKHGFKVPDYSPHKEVLRNV